MVINDIFTYLDDVHPHRFSNNVLMTWLNETEAKIFSFMNCFNANEGEIIPESFNRHTDIGEDVLIDNIEIYALYLIARIDFANCEYSHYNNDVALFNSEFEEWQAEFVRNHRSKFSSTIGY